MDGVWLKEKIWLFLMAEVNFNSNRKLKKKTHNKNTCITLRRSRNQWVKYY